MSEQQNLDIVRKGYEAFGRGDIPGLLELFDEQISWVTPGPADLPIAGSRRGHEGAREFFDALRNTLDFLRFEPKEFIAQGDRVAVVGDDTARVNATGNTLESRWVHVFTLRDSKVVAFEEFGDVSALVAELRTAQSRT